MADLDHIYDVDNDVNYTLKDTGARNDIVTINSKLLNEVYPVYFCVGGGWVVQGREYNLHLTEWSNALFNPEYDNDVMNVRVRFYDFSTPSPLDDDVLIDIDTVIEAQHRQLPVYLDKEKTIRATIGHIRGRTVDFIYVPLERTYYLVNERVLSEDVIYDPVSSGLSATNVQDAIDEIDNNLAMLTASQVGYDHTSSGLVAITVQDAIDEIAAGSGGGTAASISYDNIGSGLQATDVQDAIDEVVGSIPTKTSDLLNDSDFLSRGDVSTVALTGAYSDLSGTPTLATVATSGDYGDLLNLPNIPTSTSQLVNNSGFLTSNDIAAVAMSGSYSDLSGTPTLATVATSGDYDDLSNTPDLSTKQDTLVSGSNIKTINGASVLGSGDITTPDTKPTNHTNAGSGNVSVSNNTWTTLWNITIPKGEWIIQVAVAWQTAGGTSDNGTGFRTIELNDNSVNPGNAGFINTNTAQATTGSQTTQQMTCTVAPSSATTYTVYGRHNAGTGLQALPRIRYVKIG